MLHGTEKGHNSSKLNFLVAFLWMYECYIQEKIPWIEANYEHYFSIEILYLLLPSSSNCKKKMQTSGMGQFVWVRN